MVIRGNFWTTAHLSPTLKVNKKNHLCSTCAWFEVCTNTRSADRKKLTKAYHLGNPCVQRGPKIHLIKLASYDPTARVISKGSKGNIEEQWIGGQKESFQINLGPAKF